VKPGDPYPFQGESNPFLPLLQKWAKEKTATATDRSVQAQQAFEKSFHAGTTSVEAADDQGWVVSVTPSGG